MSKRALLAAAALCVAGYVFVYATGRASPPVRSDGYSYYVYLPAWFIYGDTSLSAVARDCCGGEFPAHTAIVRWPTTRRWVNAHPIGVALLQSPFFAVGHALTRWSNLSADGFTLYYQHAAGLAGVFWAVAGLFALRALLLRHFSDVVVTATLVVVLFGTGLYHYATYDSSYSHVYSFCLLACFLLLTEQWWEEATAVRSLAIGVVAGLIVLTRHTNALLLLIFVAYGVTSLTAARARASALGARWRALAMIAAAGLVTVAPQLAIYEKSTGRMLVSSYGDLTFTFASPHLWGVLFSVQKGLFFWSPLLLAGVAGYFVRNPAARAYAPGAALVFAADTYLIASWWDWQFGASYGHRGFIDLLPLFAIGLAAFIAWVSRSAARRSVAAVVAAAGVFLSVFQMLQYWNGVLPMSDVTWDQYRSVFLRLH
jgi:hypothetical protein